MRAVSTRLPSGDCHQNTLPGNSFSCGPGRMKM